jgi:HD superfamily phosphohydrolase
MWLFDIVSNKKSGFDLDKLDYLNRDLLHTKINLSQIGFKRIIQNARIIGNQIGYNKKVFNEINLVFNRREELFR